MGGFWLQRLCLVCFDNLGHSAKMPSGPSLQTTQDWEPVVWQKSGPKGKASKSTNEVNAARRAGTDVETDKKFGGGANQSAHSVVPNAKKLDENSETFRHDT